MNAHRHGLTGRNIVIGDEDPKKFDSLRAELWDEWQPRPGMESMLVDRLAGQIWRLLRAPAFEAAVIQFGRSGVAAETNYNGEPTYQPEEYMGMALTNDARYGDTLGKISRYETALMNGYTKTLQMLLMLRNRRDEEKNDLRLVETLPPPKIEDAA
jgi:hypothetical protein